jgi:nucleoid DNA-binding protein
MGIKRTPGVSTLDSQPYVVKIIEGIAKEYNLPPNKVKRIVDAQFHYLRGILEYSGIDNVRLHYLGIFAVKPTRRVFAQSIAEKRRLEKVELINRRSINAGNTDSAERLSKRGEDERSGRTPGFGDGEDECSTEMVDTGL